MVKIDIVDSRTVLRRCKPIISHWKSFSGVHLSFAPKKSTISASAGDDAVVVDISGLVTVGEAVDFMLPTKPFFDGVESIPPHMLKSGETDWLLTLMYKKGSCKIGSLTLKTLGNDSPPPFIPKGEMKTVAVLPNLDILLHRVIHAADRSDTRQALNSVYFDLKNGKLVATNGHVLHTVETKKVKFSAIVPYNTVKLLMDIPYDITIATVNKHIVFENDVRMQRIYTKVFEGTYPDYERVLTGISKKDRHSCTVDRVALLQVMDRVNKLAERPVVIEQGAGYISITGESQFGTRTEKISAKTVGKGTVGFNKSYLHDALTALVGAEVVTITAGEITPAIIKGGNSTDMILVMPVRLDTVKPAPEPKPTPEKTAPAAA